MRSQRVPPGALLGTEEALLENRIVPCRQQPDALTDNLRFVVSGSSSIKSL
jgi:hypothetical protein